MATGPAHIQLEGYGGVNLAGNSVIVVVIVILSIPEPRERGYRF